MLGVHIAAGTIWFARAKPDGAFVDDRPDRLVLADGLGDGRALSELEESLEETVARLKPQSIALLKPGSGLSQPKPADLLRRGHIEGVVHVACHRKDVPLELVTHNAVEKIVGKRPGGKDVREYCKLVAGIHSSETPKQWANRAPAYGAALVVAGYQGTQ